MKSIAQVMAELDPTYRSKYDQLQAKYEISGMQMQLQKNIAEAQMQLQKNIADQNSRDKWEMENQRSQTTIEVERMRGRNARGLQDELFNHQNQLQERANELERQKITLQAHTELMTRSYGAVFESYADRRKAVLNAVEENRKLRNNATLSVVNAFIQDKVAGRTMLREDYMAERNMAREMERMELQHKIKMAEMEMEHNARFILKAYELEGVHGAKVEIDRLINEWSK